MTLLVRPVDDADVAALAALVGEWGYPSDVEQVGERLAHFRASPDDFLRVAKADGVVVGWIHAAEHRTLASSAVCEILGLVVGREFRGLGIGGMLVDAAREWAAGRGLDTIVARSNVLRPESHPFYEKIGFTRTKTQHVYRRSSS